MSWQRLEAAVYEPIDCGPGLVDREAHDLGIGGAAGDAHHILEMRIGAVDDAERGLQTRAGRAHLPRRQVQRTANERRRIEQQHARPASRCENRGWQSLRAGADDDQAWVESGGTPSATAVADAVRTRPIEASDAAVVSRARRSITTGPPD